VIRPVALVALVALASLAACNSARIAGGYTVQEGAEPAGSLVGHWTVKDCRDPRGTVLSAGKEDVRLVQTGDRIVLVDEKPAYDAIVVDNGFVRGSERVYQLAIKRTSSAPYLREYRVPASGNKAGRISIVKDFTDEETDRGFVAAYRAPLVTCELLPAEDGAP
jgi:hypothetical protein